MEILINELSLCGQYASIDDFVELALPPFLSALKDINPSENQILKKNDFYSSSVTSHHTLYEIFVGPFSRRYDEIRRFKALLVNLFEDPFWENDQKHLVDSTYNYNQTDIWGSSLAESCERNKIVLSFTHEDFVDKLLLVYKDEEVINIDNLCDKGYYCEICWQRQLISFEEYCIEKFKGGKLDFSQIDLKDGFILISQENENLFFDGLRKFSELTWHQISVDDSLDYKEFNNKNYFKNIPHQIRKFRISRKYRCFGYVNEGVFFVLLFDLDHKLSDKG